MRPEELVPIFKNISSLNGIGPKLNNLFIKIAGEKIIHLIFHLPYDVIKRKLINDIKIDDVNTHIILKVKILKVNISNFGRVPHKINCISNYQEIDIIFFNAKEPYLRKNFPINEEIYISGKLDYYRNKYQINHPDHILKTQEINELKKFQSIYSLTQGLTQKIMGKTIFKIMNFIPSLEEWIDEGTIKKYNFETWKNCVEKLHIPKTIKDLDKKEQYRKRLAYDELLAHQLAIAIIRNQNKKNKGIKIKLDNYKLEINNFIKKFPFTLTESQEKVIDEIYNDLSSENQMVRLLQGDVGSGKTIVSIVGMYICHKLGYQSSIMVPTEILAYQHFQNIKNIMEPYGIIVELLTSKDKGKTRKEKTEKIINGEVDIVIGTHVLIQNDIQFKKLAFIIIDESHKFGVYQRLSLAYKGIKPNILVMTATPIPRTLTLATYGDISESRILQKPKGRLDVITKSIPSKKINNLINAIKDKIKNKEKIFWICPLVEESEVLDLEAATKRYEKLMKIYKDKVLLIHGRMKSEEKDKIMNKFKYENFNILVATTVIEVGIDIPKATTLIIEHAERFGLSQLHQLRGSVGRKNKQSNCILIYKDENISQNAKKRILTMKETNDGFKIAEKDLIIRGSGEILGKKLSGIPNFRIADLSFDEEIFLDVRNYVHKIMKNNHYKNNEINKKIKLLLYLFEKDLAIKTLMSG